MDKTVGQNVTASLDGSILTLRVDLSVPGAPSASGKSHVLGTTQGNVTIGDVKVGLNVYRPR